MLCVYRILLVFVLLFPECEWMKNAYITRDKYIKILVTLVSLVINYIQVKFLYHRKEKQENMLLMVPTEP